MNLKIFFASVLILCLGMNLIAQKWSTETYPQGPTSFVDGIGPKHLDEPFKLVVNQVGDLNIYFVTIGLEECNDRSVVLKFDGDDDYYYMNITLLGGNAFWRIIETEDGKFPTLSDSKLLEKLKKHSTLSVKFQGDCGTIDILFPLKGSSKAINFVLSSKTNQTERIDNLKNNSKKCILSGDYYWTDGAFKLELSIVGKRWFAESIIIPTGIVAIKENGIIVNNELRSYYNGIDLGVVGYQKWNCDIEFAGKTCKKVN